MTIVAIMQNMWFHNPPLMEKILARRYNGDREEFIADYLFFRCKTGKVLTKVLGEELCNRIVWEEASPKIGGKSDSKFPADSAHIRGVLNRNKPAIVLGFGGIAHTGLVAVVPVAHVIVGPHPAARQGDVYARIGMMVKLLARITPETPKEFTVY